MLIVTYAECHFCCVSLMLSVTYAVCHVCGVSLMQALYAEYRNAGDSNKFTPKMTQDGSKPMDIFTTYYHCIL
jgi:hypothetical protein